MAKALLCVCGRATSGKQDRGGKEQRQGKKKIKYEAGCVVRLTTVPPESMSTCANPDARN